MVDSFVTVFLFSAQRKDSKKNWKEKTGKTPKLVKGLTVQAYFAREEIIS